MRRLHHLVGVAAGILGERGQRLLVAEQEDATVVEDAVLAAWKHFSEAIQVYPDTGPNWGSCNALAAPLFFSKPKPPALDVSR